MIDERKILGLIPARGGSKGIKKKNIVLLKGKPLIYYSIQSALKSKHLDRVAVSTEDPQIAEIAKTYGAEIIPRPEEFARDDSPDFDVVNHALHHYDSKGEPYDLVVMLRPTAPFRTAEQIDEAIGMMQGHDTLRSVRKVGEHPYWMKTVNDDGMLRPLIKGKDEKTYYQRQMLPDVYILSGLIDIVSRHQVLNGHLYGKEVRAFIAGSSIDIDDPEDLKKAEDQELP
jgi:CMP-N-acetylneuraminic acid synthetase